MPPTTPPNPDEPQFLSTVPMQDPTFRTPGSEIPEAIYAASDAEAFRLPNIPAAPVRHDNPRFAVALALLLLAIIAVTVIYLFRDANHATPPPASHPRSYQKSSPRTAPESIRSQIGRIPTRHPGTAV